MQDVVYKEFSKSDIVLLRTVEDFCKNFLGVSLDRTGILVAYSTGVDSTALLLLFFCLREKYKLRLAAAHLNHGLRSESREESEFAQSICSSLKIPLYTCHIDIQSKSMLHKCGMEECARRERYLFLEQCRKYSGMEWIATAHHIGDLAEDILMRLSRGTSWPGLGGMSALIQERHILRPFLLTEKSVLYSFVKNCGMEWREDSSNTSRKWKRNRIRMDFIPLFLQENPQFYKVIRTLWKTARDDEIYWKKIFANMIVRQEKDIFISGQDLFKLGRAGRLRIFAEAIRRFNIGQPRSDTLENMEAAWNNRQFPKKFSFQGELNVYMSKKGIRFFQCKGR